MDWPELIWLCSITGTIWYLFHVIRKLEIDSQANWEEFRNHINKEVKDNATSARNG